MRKEFRHFRDLFKLSRQVLIKRYAQAIWLLDVATVKECLRLGVDPNIIPKDYAALQAAAINNHVELANVMLAQPKINVNLCDEFHWTALFFACKYDSYEVAVLILQTGKVNRFLTDKFGNSAFNIAAKCGHIRMCELLNDYSFDIDHENAYGQSALYHAVVDTGNITLARLLIMWGANPNPYWKKGRPLIIDLCIVCHTLDQLDLVILLLESGVPVDIVDPLTYRTCLHFAALSGYIPLINVLLDYKARINVLDRDNFTPVDVAESHSNYTVIEVLNTELRHIYSISATIDTEPD